MDTNIRTYSSDKTLVNERRTHIAESAVKLWGKQGYDKTNMRKLAKACGISTGSLYHYFGSKQEILDYCIGIAASRRTEFITRCYDLLQSVGAQQAIRDLIRLYYQSIDWTQDVIVFAYQETRNLTPDAQQGIKDSDYEVVSAFEKLLRKGIETGEFQMSNPLLVANNIVVIGQMWAFRRWFLRKHTNLEEFIREQTEYILKLILVESARTAGNKGDASGIPVNGGEHNL